MSKKPQCTECDAELTAWDNTNETAGKTQVLTSTVGLLGTVGAFFTLLVTVFLFKNKNKDTIWKCHHCNKKFTGDELKPFEWSDYK